MKWFLNVLFQSQGSSTQVGSPYKRSLVLREEVSAVNSVYGKTIEFSHDSKEVNKILGKVLHAAKFNELADRIADRAVKKISEYQNSKFTEKLVTNGVFRTQMKTAQNDDANYSVEKLRGPAKHKHGKIDVDAVLKKTAPVNDLKLRYSYLKNKHAKAALRTKEPHIDDDDTDSQGTNYNVNLNEAPNIHQDYNKLAHDIKLDFDQNIKTLSNENFQHFLYRPYDSRTKTNHRQKSERKFRSEADFLKFGENAPREKELSRTTRTEGDKQFAHVESPDYKEYHELVANAESS